MIEQFRIQTLKTRIERYATDMKVNDDLETIIESYHHGIEHLNELLTIYKSNNYPQEPILFILAEHFFPYELEKSLEHSFVALQEKANTLRTKKGKVNRYQKYMDTLILCAPHIPSELDDYLESLKKRITIIICEY